MSYADDNVIPFPGITVKDLDPELVLAMATKVKFERVFVIGVLEDGSEYRASSCADGGTVLWDMERAKHRLMQLADAMANTE